MECMDEHERFLNGSLPRDFVPALGLTALLAAQPESTKESDDVGPRTTNG